MDFNVDLHLHSYYSDDGEYTPKELIDIGYKNKMSVLAIADHNSTQGVKEAVSYGKTLGITVIPAIELDCTYNNINLHVLGYGVNPDYEKFEENRINILNQEKRAAAKKVQIIKELGIYVDDDKVKEISKDGVVTGEIIAEVALGDERNKDNKLLKEYFPGGNRDDNPYVNFYWDFCSQGKPAYVEIKYITLTEAINMINRAGGVAVLAHPGNNIKENIDILDGIVEEGIVGIEAFSSYHSEYQRDFYIEQASRLKLSLTCGSDFHGKTKPKIQIGSVDCTSKKKEILDGLIKHWLL
ncbi:PHP domain-containing protein [Clostridium sp. Sa3CVN1]|uniref:PHP domain-containing protein n=1 Tax=Clostridium cibarium TaxID=2762247 RepID=A0ABR8PR37_9CLOT|nr:PHP domain-containing protein [Clostridium cibarium]